MSATPSHHAGFGRGETGLDSVRFQRFIAGVPCGLYHFSTGLNLCGGNPLSLQELCSYRPSKPMTGM